MAGLGVDASALYDQRSAKVTSSSEKETIKQQQIAIPVNLRYTVGLGSLANVIFFAGPQWGINVGDDDFKWNDGSSYSLKKSNFSKKRINSIYHRRNTLITGGKKHEYHATAFPGNS